MAMTVRFIITAIFPGLFLSTVYSQPSFDQNDFQKTLRVFDRNGKIFVNPPIDIDGSPFFNEKWKNATIKFSDKQVFNSVPVRLDLMNQEVHYLNPEKSEMVISPGVIRELVFKDSVSGQPVSYDFKSGYAPVDNQNEINFYLVLCEGKLSLLKSMRKKIRERKDDLSGDVKKELILYEDYYFETTKGLRLVKPNKAFLLENMQDQKDKVDEFVKSNNLSYKSFTDLKKIISFYNSL